MDLQSTLGVMIIRLAHQLLHSILLLVFNYSHSVVFNVHVFLFVALPLCVCTFDCCMFKLQLIAVDSLLFSLLVHFGNIATTRPLIVIILHNGTHRNIARHALTTKQNLFIGSVKIPLTTTIIVHLQLRPSTL